MRRLNVLAALPLNSLMLAPSPGFGNGLLQIHAAIVALLFTVFEERSTRSVLHGVGDDDGRVARFSILLDMIFLHERRLECDMHVPKPMTIGQLARRTGVSIKVLREYDRLGLIYTLGRNESNYGLFDESALWCVQVIGTLRSLGLTLKEIREIAAVYLERPEEPIDP